MNDSRAASTARPPTYSAPASVTLLAAGREDGKVVAIGTARLCRPSRADSSPPAAPRGSRPVPATGSPTLDCARAGQHLADVPDVRTLIDRMRNTTPADAPDF
ncbi:hypothetical protein HUT19_41980 (plasmid) [Streptomyces sp. NA02950]|uniref:hypothetical protein n=1 Tax=Streptomyces sp. NA02950 TaxID=2742137 RepID=UPI0015906CD5|nr:hypothetical protein [Streptomyces sp. NA02950]QKV98288.1 hypothetical protein HUT19_41980 [Streptomyces sp. NA02950]